MLCQVIPLEHGFPKINAPWLHPIAHSTAHNPTLYLLYYLPLYHLFPKQQTIDKISLQNRKSKNPSNKTMTPRSVHPYIHTSIHPSPWLMWLILFSFANILCLLYTISLSTFVIFFMFMLVIICGVLVCVCVSTYMRVCMWGQVFGNLMHVKAHLFLPSLT